MVWGFFRVIVSIFKIKSMSLFTETIKLVQFSSMNNILLKKCHRLGGKADKFTLLFVKEKEWL